MPQTPNIERPLLLWPGVAAVTLLWLVRLGLPLVAPEAAPLAVIGALAGSLIVLVWWLFFSRAERKERWGALGLMIVAIVATRPLLDPSISTGMMGMMFPLYAIPVLSLALVAWAVVTRNLSDGFRHAALAATILTACGVFTILRTDGITGEGSAQWKWRWAPTAEQLLLARVVPPPPPREQPAPAVEQSPTVAPAAITPSALPPSSAFWPGFRGPHRDSVVTGVRIGTDWASAPPVELWRRHVGPGWSSFAVRDGLLYTQEQRGESEIVSCYNAKTGEPVWIHSDAARFYESNGGAGPRATPTLHGSRVYTFGATGIVNALDAATGAVAWTRNAATDTGAALPGWGFSGSPLVANDLVIVAASGRLAAYSLATGDPRWMMKEGRGSYASPHMLTIGGVAQVVLLTGEGATSFAPASGKVLWKHEWPGSTILQPALTADGGLLITTGDMAGGAGTRRLALARGPDSWTATEVWTSNGLKPYFNDLVVHKGHAYGFDGSILACIGLTDGKRKWKGGRYGHGQMLLLPSQDLLLVLAEEGELVLVSATPGKFTEIARIPALQGKTWNHPVLIGNLLLVRNGEEMVAFRLPPEVS